MGIAVVRCDVVSGKIFKAYENIKVMADDEDISIQTAYYRTSKNTKPMNGEKYMFANDYMKMFPDTGAANMEGIKEKMVMDKNETYDNELELDKSPAVKKKPKKEPKKTKAAPKTQKAEPEPPKAEYEPPKAEPDSLNPQPVSDISEGKDALWEEAKKIANSFDGGEKDYWHIMCYIFGPCQMKLYAHIQAMKYMLCANDDEGYYKEYMHLAAWYTTKAAELEEKANG